MGIVSSLFEKRNYAPDDNYWYYPVLKETASGMKVDEANALEHPDVWKCVRVISETIASLPLFVYRRLPNTGKDKLNEHPIYWLLHYQPNSEMTSFQFREVMMAHLLLWGNFYAQIQKARNNVTLGLWPLHPGKMSVERGDDTLLQYRYRPSDPKTEEIVFSSDEILHIPGLGFNGITGYSPITMCREAIGLGMAAAEFASRFFANGAITSGVLEHPGKLGQQAQDNLRKSLTETHVGISKVGVPMILEEGMKWNTTSMPLRDAQFLELRKFQRTEICGIYRVPPHLISDVEPSTSWGTGIEQQTIGFVIYTLRPWLVRIEQAINVKLFPERDQGDIFCEHLVDGLLRGDSAARGQYYREMFNVGALSINDILNMENRNPIPNGDKHYVPLNMVEVGKEPPPTSSTPPINLSQKSEEEDDDMSQEEKDELNKLRQKYPEVQKALSDLNASMQERESQFIEIRGNFDAADGKIKELEIRINALSKTIEIRDREVIDLNASVVAKDKMMLDKTIEVKRLSDKLAIIESQVEMIKKQGCKRLLIDAVERIVRRESISIKRGLQEKDLPTFKGHIDKFYEELPEFMTSALHPALSAYSITVNSTGAINCLQSYIPSHIKESRQEIEAWNGVLLHDTTDFKKNRQAIDDSLNLWIEKRPEWSVNSIQSFFVTT